MKIVSVKDLGPLSESKSKEITKYFLESFKIACCEPAKLKKDGSIIFILKKRKAEKCDICGKYSRNLIMLHHPSYTASVCCRDLCLNDKNYDKKLQKFKAC